MLCVFLAFRQSFTAGWILAAGILLAQGCSRSEPSVEKTAPQKPVRLQILDYDGLQKLIAAKGGRVVVMDVWSTSCEPCVREFPELVALAKRHSAESVDCISLSLDYYGVGAPADLKPRVLKFLEMQQATFDNVLSSLESDEMSKKLEVSAPPAVFVYDRQGKLRKQFDNRHAPPETPFNYDQIEQLVKELLAETSQR